MTEILSKNRVLINEKFPPKITGMYHFKNHYQHEFIHRLDCVKYGLIRDSGALKANMGGTNVTEPEEGHKRQGQ